jgi:hypothetical protein
MRINDKGEKIYENRRTQEEYIDKEIEKISLIEVEHPLERISHYFGLIEKLEKKASQYGGHYLGVGAACYEGCIKIRKLIREKK